MKKSRVLALLLACASVFGAACGGGGHKHDFSCKVEEEKYLKSAASCQDAARYYYSCECGEKGDKAFPVGKKLVHDYSAKTETDEYLKTAADCQNNAQYFYSCIYCGKKSYSFFESEKPGDHNCINEVADAKYLKSEATLETSAVYYKSCICGLVGEETFSYGTPLRKYTDEEKAFYMPTSLTMTLYDTQTATYGFTYNTQNEPLRPVIQVAKGESLTDYVEYTAHVQKASSYETQSKGMTYYIVKAEIPLEDSTTYTYRAYDKYVDVGTEPVTIQTKNLKVESFTFAHVSDSQSSENVGDFFGGVLKNLVGKSDFVVHTGDVVEDSKLELEWKNMLNANFAYLSKIPVMAISGNHETTYKHGSDETFKHFNQKITEQDTKLGYYYSFTYGNAKFIMLNTNRLSGNALTADQYDWLIDELENNTATWTFVAMHNPMYSAGNYGSDPSKNQICLSLRAQLRAIFVEYGVDVVLQGHDHVVSHTHPIDGAGNAISTAWETVDGVAYATNPSGVIYEMSGPAGRQTRSPNSYMNANLYHKVEGSNMCSWSEFAIEGNKLTVTHKYTNLTSVYEYTQWGIIKSA